MSTNRRVVALARAIAQVLIYFVAVVGIAKLAWTPVKGVLGPMSESSDPVRVVFAISFLAIGVAITNWIMAQFGKSKLAWAGWPKPRTAIRWYVTGMLTGIGMSGGMLFLTYLLGGAELTIREGQFQDYVARMQIFLLAMFIATLAEEWLFRGYPLYKLSKVIGKGSANVAMALLFVSFHLGASGWTWLVATNIFLGSLVVGSLRFTPGASRLPGDFTLHGTAFSSR